MLLASHNCNSKDYTEFYAPYGLRTLRTVIVALANASASALALVFKVPALIFLILSLWLSALFFFLCHLDKLVGNVINDSV